MTVRRLFWMKIGVALGFLVVLASCGYKDIDKRFFVVSVGIDRNDQADREGAPRYRILLKMAIPQADIKAGQEEFVLIGEQSDSITDAVRRIKAKVDKELDFSHAKVLLFGEDVVKEGNMNRLLDWFMRRRDIQKIAWVGVARPNAEKLLLLKPKSERLPSNALFLSFGQSGTESAYIVSEYLFSFRKRLIERGLDPVLPLIEMSGGDLLQINKAVAMNKDRMVTLLNPEETKVLNIISNRTKEAEIEVNQAGDLRYYLSIDKANTRYKVIASSDTDSYVAVDVRLAGAVEEAAEDIGSADVQQLKKAAEQGFKKKIEGLLSKLQARGVDPVGLGLIYRGTRLDAEDWKQWEEIYPNVKFKVNVNVTIQGIGGLH